MSETDDLTVSQDPPVVVDPFFGRLDAIIDILVAATGFDLRRSGETRRRADGNVDVFAAGTSPVTLARASGYRRGLAIFNDSTAVMYLKLGPAASTSDFTLTLNQNDYYEVPSGYRGEVSAVWASATGQARVTEYE